VDIIVLDASPLLDDRPLKKSTTRALFDACERDEVRIVVPSVVVDEVVNAAHGSFSVVRKRVREANRVLQHQFDSPKVIDEPDVDGLTSQFRTTFEQELRNHGVEVPDVTKASLQDVIDRDLAKRKPFDASGRGLRDALIWGAIAELAEDSEEDRIIFVTRNKNDFADPSDPSRLHQDLANELSDPQNVQMVEDLGAVFEVLGMRREDLRAVLSDAVLADRLTIALKTTDYVDLPTPPGLDGEIVGAEIIDFEVGDVFYAWGAASGTVSATVEYIFSGILDEWEVEGVDARWSSIQVDEWNHENHFVAVSGESSATLELTVALDPESDVLDLLNAEVLSSEYE
jgi:hypothetical protein